MVRAFVLHELLVGQKPFTAFAVKAGIASKVDVALVVDLLQDILDGFDVVRVGGTDEIVRRDGQRRPGLTKLTADSVCVLLWLYGGIGGRLGYFVPGYAGNLGDPIQVKTL